MEKLKEQQDKFDNPTSGCAMFSVQLLPKDEEELCEYDVLLEMLLLILLL